MKKIISILLILMLATSVFAQTLDEEAVEDGLSDFIEGLAVTAPASTTMSNVWTDAYVGQLIGVPPHLGAGASFGVSKMDITGIKKAAKALGISSTDGLKDDFILPVASIDAVIGGVLFPFDLSGSFIVMNEPIGISGNKALQYKLNAFNLKIRLPIIKQNLVLPNLSIGVGYARTSGEFHVALKQGVETFLTATYQSDVYSADVQLSKNVFFLTPYAGARVLASKSNNTWEYSYEVAGVISGKGKSSYSNDNLNFGYQVFAGTSFNILILRLNVNAAYDFASKVWSVGAGAQIKL